MNSKNDLIKRLLKDQFCSTCFYRTSSVKELWKIGDEKPKLIEIDACRLYGCPPSNLTCNDWKDKNSDPNNSILIG